MAIKVPRPPGPSARSANMRANRRRDSKLELAVRSILHGRGLRYRVDHPIWLDGRRPIRADIVFTRPMICVELDGCWWHGCPSCGERATSVNEAYWSAKIARNKERDAETTAALEAAGWKVLRFWEHEPAEEIAAVVEQQVRAASAARDPRLRTRGPGERR